MRDSGKYSHAPDYLRVSVTDRCNLRCIYCMGEDGIHSLSPNKILSFEEISTIVRAGVARGIRQVRVTGGEPLVRKGVVEFIAGLVDEPGIEDVSLTTNGILLDELADGLWEAGLRRLNISMDSLDSSTFETISRRPLMSNVWNGIEHALELGFNPIKINVVVLRGINEKEITNFAELTRHLPLHVRFIEWMNFSDSGEPDYFVPLSEIRKVCEDEAPLHPTGAPAGRGPARYFQYPSAKGTIGFIASRSHPFCDACRRLRLTSEGRLLACLQDSHGIDLKSILRNASPEALDEAIDAVFRLKRTRYSLKPHQFQHLPQSMASIGG